LIPQVEENTFSFDEEGIITIEEGSLLPSVRYSLMMTLSHKDEIELNPGCLECTTLRGITFEVHDLVPPEFALSLDPNSSLNHEDSNQVMIDLFNQSQLDFNRIQVEFEFTP
jgi:hypothetical protein